MNLGLKMLGVAAGFFLLGFLWSEYGNAVLLWQTELPFSLRIITAFAVGIVLWHATGFDDAVLFARNLSLSKTRREETLSHLGLYASVLAMLAVVYASGTLVADTVRQFRWIIVFALVYVAWETFPDDHWLKKRILKMTGRSNPTEKQNHEDGWTQRMLKRFRSWTAYPFILQFATFTANSSDDYVANTTAMVILTEETVRYAMLAGVFFGALSMAWLVHRYREKIIPRDFPALRAWIFLGVATVIAVA